jgi:hypothetical protein
MHLPLLLLLAALPLALAQETTSTSTTNARPRPSPTEADPCLQRKFLSALICSDMDPTWTNVTLAADGWLCCWEQSISAPGNLKISWVTIATTLLLLAVPCFVFMGMGDVEAEIYHMRSAWLDVDEKGDSVQRCLHRGGCVSFWVVGWGLELEGEERVAQDQNARTGILSFRFDRMNVYKFKEIVLNRLMDTTPKPETVGTWFCCK